MINERQAHKFCKDDISKIENYDKAIADTTQTWVIHHRLELTLDGEFALSREQLKMHDMYYSRPYYELIFLTRTEHTKLHSSSRTLTTDTKIKISKSLTGRSLSEEHRRKLTGRIPWNKGKTDIYSDETRMKMGEAKKGRTLSKEHRRKMSEAHKGKHHTEESRRKISEAAKRRWIRHSQQT